MYGDAGRPLVRYCRAVKLKKSPLGDALLELKGSNSFVSIYFAKKYIERLQLI